VIDQIPKGWTRASVADVVQDIHAGFASGEKKVEYGVPHLRMNNIGLSGDLVLDILRTVPPALAKSHYDLRPGDVLVCTTNSGKLVGKCAYFDLSGRYAFSNHLTRLRPKPEIIDGRFLRWFLFLLWKSGEYDDKCKHWVNQSTIPKDVLLETKLAVPPLAEQHRIVLKIEKLFDRVNDSQKRLLVVATMVKRLRQSIISAACSGRLSANWRTNRVDEEEVPATWKRCRLDSLFAVKSGGTPSRRVKEYYERGNVPWVKTGELKNRDIIETAEFITTRGVEESNAKVFPIGTILIAMYGEGKTRGQIGRLTFPAATNQACAALVNTELPEVTNRYVFTYLLGQYYQLRAQAIGGNQPNLSLGIIKEWELLLPPVDEQHEILRRTNSLLGVADEIEAHFARLQTYVDGIKQSTIYSALRGKLVPAEMELAETKRSS